MAACEIIGTSFAARITYKVTQDVAKNKSTVRVTKLEMRSLTSMNLNCYIKGYISVNGVKTTELALTGTTACSVTMTKNYAGGGEGDAWFSGFSTKSVTVYHEDDGTAKIPIYANLFVYYNSAQLDYGINKTVKVSLPQIPRVSELTAAAVELGKEMTIKISRAASAFTDTVKWSCGALSGTIASKTSATSLKWTAPLELASQVPDSTKASVTLTVTTYQGSTKIGSKTLAVSCGVPASVAPSLTVSVTDKLGYSEACGGFVQNQSQARVKTQAAGAYGSTIKSIAVRCGKLTGTGADLSFALEESGTTAISVTVTDSRGRKATKNTSITVLAYKKPSVTITDGYRCDEAGNRQSDGEWLRLIFNSKVTALTGNSAAYTGSCTVHGGDQTRQVSLTDYEGLFSVTGGSFLISAGLDTAYDCKIAIQDRFCTVESDQVLISVAFALLDMCRDTKAIGIGMRARTAERLSIGLAADMTEHGIVNMADPVSSQDAATKAYVDRKYQELLGMIQNMTGG